MARQATAFGKQRELLDTCLDNLRKYANDKEWRTVPNYQERIAASVTGARAAFGNILEMLQAEIKEGDKAKESEKPLKKAQ